ncbi:MAG TPA: hypothetical protein VGC21_06420 [Telluria sp.]|jgi:hypothetical protein
MTSIFRLAAIAAVAAVAVQLTGCANLAMSPPSANMATTTKLRQAGAAPAAVGTFKAGAEKSVRDDAINMRGSNSVAAPGGSFAQYLADTLKVELKSAGLLDPASPAVITGTLTQNDIDAAIGTGTAKLGARFVVTRAGAVKYDREVVVNGEWESSFMAAAAIPLAASNYEGLYRKLIAKLVDDAAFRAALAPQ